MYDKNVVFSRYFKEVSILFEKLKKTLIAGVAFLLAFTNIAACAVYADEVTREDINAARQSIAAATNQIPGWPTAPLINSESAILMDADSGVILYNKNMDEIHYPASTTKVMTCLLAAENCAMDEIVTFSKEAVFGIDRGSSNVGIDVGECLTMEEAIYCVMLASANEVASAIAEHISGSVEEFANLMNKRAAELGCTHTHFMNANGLPNEEHLTTAHDLALIAQAFNKNETLKRIASTPRYEVKATVSQPDTFTIPNHHKMYPGNSNAYEYTTWGKTGYTNVARSTLVTCAEKDGMNLVCVVMKCEPTFQYGDTENLFEYGFNNFQKLYIVDNETKYNFENSDFFETDSSIFGSAKSLLSLDNSGYCIVPKSVNFDELVSSVSYDTDNEKEVARINYTYEDYYVGSTALTLAANDTRDFAFGTASISSDSPAKSETVSDSADKGDVIYINASRLRIAAIIGGVIIVILIIMWLLMRKNHYSNRRRKSILKRNKRYSSEFDDFDF